MRGQEACEAEWSLVCAAHNLRKLFRHGAAAVRKANQLADALQQADLSPIAA